MTSHASGILRSPDFSNPQTRHHKLQDLARLCQTRLWSLAHWLPDYFLLAKTLWMSGFRNRMHVDTWQCCSAYLYCLLLPPGASDYKWGRAKRCKVASLPLPLTCFDSQSPEELHEPSHTIGLWLLETETCSPPCPQVSSAALSEQPIQPPPGPWTPWTTEPRETNQLWGPMDRGW